MMKSETKQFTINGQQQSDCPYCHSGHILYADFESSVKVYPHNVDANKQILKVVCEKHPEQFVSKFCTKD
jgi:hypothetical protein